MLWEMFYFIFPDKIIQRDVVLYFGSSYIYARKLGQKWIQFPWNPNCISRVRENSSAPWTKMRWTNTYIGNVFLVLAMQNAGAQKWVNNYFYSLWSSSCLKIPWRNHNLHPITSSKFICHQRQIKIFPTNNAIAVFRWALCSPIQHVK